MARCRATTRAGTRCRNVAMEGSAYCGVHRQAADEDEPGRPAAPPEEDGERLEREAGPSRPHGDPLARGGRTGGDAPDGEEVEIEVEILEGGCLGCLPGAAALLLLLLAVVA